MSRILRWAAIAAPIAMAGCAGMVAVNDPIHPPHYIRNEEFYAARSGQIRVEVNGNTFGMQPDAFATHVVDLMRASYYRHDWFTREVSRKTDPRFKIVMMFDPDPAISGQNLCEAAQPFKPVPPASGASSHLLAAFCGGTEVISEVEGTAYGGVANAQDPKFKELVARVTNNIIPKDDPAEQPSSWEGLS